MEKLRLTCLGSFDLRCGGQEIAAGNRKARALLAYLALVKGVPQRREALATLLWERSAQRQALNSLNQAIYVLRRELVDAECAEFAADAENLCLDTAQVEVDALRFEALAKGHDADNLRAALALYRGPLIPGFSASAPAFEQWLQIERARLGDLAAEAGTRLMELAEGDPTIKAHAESEVLISIDPYNEVALRVQMRHLARTGRSARAVNLFETFRDRMKDDLDVVPTEATRAVHDAIRSGEINAVSFSRPSEAAKSVPPALSNFGGPWIKGLVLGSVLMLGAAAAFWFAERSGQEQAGLTSPRLLVLPISLQEGIDSQQSAAGLIDDLAAELARFSDLELLSRETARARNVWSAADAQASGASHILRTSLRTGSDSTTLIIRLINATDDTEVWGQRYVLEGGELLSLRERILENITRGLRVELTNQPDGKRDPTDDAAAFDAYLSGLAAFHQASPEQHKLAVEQFGLALAKDPDFTLARAALAQTHFRSAFGAQAYADSLELNWIEAFLALKVALANRALAGDPGTLALKAQLALRRRDIAGAREAARAAVAVAPGDYRARLTMAQALIYAGERDAALVELKNALALNPMRPANSFFLMALTHFGAGEIAQADEWVERVSATGDAVAPEFYALAAATKGLIHENEQASDYLGKYVQALQTRPRRLWRSALAPTGNPRALTWDRPSLASTMAGFPFVQIRSVEQLAKGLTMAGIGGHTLGYYAATESQRLAEADIRPLLFGASVQGTSPFGDGALWRQDRTDDGVMMQSTGLGPAPLSREAQSVVWNDQICDRWEFKGNPVEMCGTLFRVSPDTVLPGQYLLFNELTYFPVSVLID